MENMIIWKAWMLKLECFFDLEKRRLSHTQGKTKQNKKKNNRPPSFFFTLRQTNICFFFFYASSCFCIMICIYQWPHLLLQNQHAVLLGLQESRMQCTRLTFNGSQVESYNQNEGRGYATTAGIIHAVHSYSSSQIHKVNCKNRPGFSQRGFFREPAGSDAKINMQMH